MNVAQQNILDHYHYPEYQGSLEKPSHTATCKNTTCGDVLTLTLEIKSGIIQKAAFSGEGCAISQAAADLFIEMIIGKHMDSLKEYTKDDIVKLIGLELSPNRLKCALLCLETAQRATKSEI